MDPPHASSIPSSSSSMPTPGSASTSANKPKKFKLDPMSMLLPHERPGYRGSPAACRSMPPIHNQFQLQPQPGSPAYFAMLQSQQVQQDSATQRIGIPARTAASMGEQGGKRGESSGSQIPTQAPVGSQHPAQGVPLSPPASMSSTPQSGSWEDSASQWSSMEGVVDGKPASGQRSQPSRHYAPRMTQGNMRLEDWEIVETLGTGTFGRVLLVRQRPSYRPTPYHPIFPHLYRSRHPLSPSPSTTQKSDDHLPHFAMKVLRKSEIVRLKQVEHINSERIILERVRHPFIVELHATYQDQINVYMLLSYIPGGELFSHLRRAGRFSADVTRFYLASIVLAIEYLHSRNIIYRDLKPENLLLDRHGYLRIADFGFAKVVQDRTFTLCGTPEYLAPEIVLSQGHGKAVDWWALGILGFEMLAGYPPFFDDHPLGIYEKILRGDIAFPSHIDPFAKDLIRGLLTADRSKRLGNLRGGAKDVMGHPWFAGVDWRSLERKEIGAPIVPRVASMGDSQNFQRYPPPRPQDLPGVFGQTYNTSSDPCGELFTDFSFPRGESERGSASGSAEVLGRQ
ncbi:protein kinase A [Cryptococcus neoformans AD2-60a]|nr:protein kinase A [Cryptococcus neoformans var. grubii AD2-60a]